MDAKEVEFGLDSNGSGHGPVAFSSEHNNEHSRSRKCKEFFDQLRDYQLLVK
jgi:hypothetical protein